MNRRWHILGLLMALIVGVGLGALTWVIVQFQPVSSTTAASVRFDIPKGQAVQVIAQRLTEQHLIRNPWLFRLEVKRRGLESKFKPGSFELSPHMSLSEIANTLTLESNDLWVTLLEGWRREEIAASLAKQEFTQFDEDEFLTLTASDEGKLFPDTYLIPRQATAEEIAALLTSTFDRKVTQGLAAEIKQSTHPFDEALIMASLVEREARDPEQMKEVAGILWNRLEKGMPLQVDATLQYAKGYDVTQKTWWLEPTSQDKQQVSPFNTYLNTGLPPQPIANPGLDAIKAALKPNQTENLFYIHDREGKVHYAKTLEEHNQNIERYLRS